MMKKLLMAALVVSGLMFSACSETSEGEEKIAIQQMLDQGDYDGVIKAIGVGSTPSENMLLGAAFMGRAGVGITDLIDVVNSSGDSGSNAFGSFADSLSEKTKNNPNALQDLTSSSNAYLKVMEKDCGTDVLTTSEKDVCLFSGLSQTVKAATAISYIAGDLSTLSGGSGGADTKLTTSACAMQYAFDGNTTACDALVSDGNVTFTGTNKTYEAIRITQGAESFKYIISNSTVRSPAVTNGFCSLTDFSSKVDTDSTPTLAAPYACPVDRSTDVNEEITITEVLVDALNNGTDAIAATSDEIKDNIEEFKCEVLGGEIENGACVEVGSSTSISTATTITTQNVIDYLNSNNK